MRNIYFLAVALALLFSVGAKASVSLTKLKVLGLAAPLGVDEIPTFSWQTVSDARGFRQSSYQITVTDADGNVVWNSGTVSSPLQSGIKYAGQPLKSRSAYTWTVQIKGKDGSVSDKTSSTFETAMLSPSEWTAKWIHANRLPNARVEINLNGASSRYLRLDATRLGYPPSTDNTGWYMQFSEIEIYSGNQKLTYTPSASSNMNWTTIWNLNYLNDGLVADNGALGYTTQKLTSANQHVWLTFDFGKSVKADRIVLYPRQDDHANGHADLVASFPEAFTLQTSNDNRSYSTIYTWNGSTPSYINNTNRVPYFGKKFTVNKPIKRARIYATGLGVFTMKLNGKAVTENKLEPGESEYEKSILYSTYDVTPLLQQGTNSLTAQVAGALYNVEVLSGRFSKGEVRNSGQTALLAELHVQYEDGTEETIATDGSWKSTASPILGSNWWGGEDYDARQQIADINSNDVDMSSWSNVSVITPRFASTQASGFGTLKSRMYEPLRVVEQWKAVNVNTTHSGGYTLQVVDFGRNFAGQYRFRLKGKPGQTITLREGESLNADGSVYMENYYTGAADTYETYTFRGDEDGEEWGPEMMYHGFRYLQIIGLDEKPDPSSFTAMRIRSDVDNYGKFETSNKLLNDIHVICRDAIASQLYNCITDCPHREKLGWLDVPNEMFNSLTYNFDMRQFFRKVVMDCFDSQYSDGHVPSTVPHYMSVYDNDPNWGGAAILVPYRCWKTYGDRTMMEQYYTQMKRLMDYYTSQTTNGIMNNISVLSDWGQETAGVNPMVSTEFTITTTYYYMLRAMAEMAATLGHANDSVTFAANADKTRSAFNARFYKGNGVYGNGQQSEQAMPLYYGLVEEQNEKLVAQKLADRVKSDGYKIKTGEIGLKPLFMALAKYGYNDIVFSMSQQTDCPSYGYWVVQGYTTTPEYWNVGAFSQNHCMMDHIEEWMYSELGGIKNGGDGFRNIVINPYIPSQLSSANVSTENAYGEILSSYSKADSTFHFSVPANCQATITIPVVKGLSLLENGKVLKAGENGIVSVAYNDDSAQIVVGGGDYKFKVGKPVATGIKSLQSINERKGKTYNLLGMVVENPSNGVFIRNGRKVLFTKN